MILIMSTSCFSPKSTLRHKDIVHHIITLGTHSLPFTLTPKSVEPIYHPVSNLVLTYQSATVSMAFFFPNVEILTVMYYLSILTSSHIFNKNLKCIPKGNMRNTPFNQHSGKTHTYTIPVP